MKNHMEQVTVMMVSLLETSTSGYGANTSANYLNSLLMYGSANAAWVPCTLLGIDYPAKIKASGGWMSNVDAQDMYVLFNLPMPTTKGSLKLYISGLRLVIFDADATDYVTQVIIYPMKETGAAAAILQDTTDRTAQGDYTYTFTAADCSTYDLISVYVQTVNTDAADLDFGPPLIRCYYAT